MLPRPEQFKRHSSNKCVGCYVTQVTVYDGCRTSQMLIRNWGVSDPRYGLWVPSLVSPLANNGILHVIPVIQKEFGAMVTLVLDSCLL
jgi:hypothetical protein